MLEILSELKIMQQIWKSYWLNIFSRSKFLLYGFLLALIPFFLNFFYYREKGLLLYGFMQSILYGVVVSLVVWFTFLIAFAGLIWMHLWIGTPKTPKWWFYLLISVTGTLIGIWLVMYLKSIFLSESMSGGTFFISLIVGLIIVIVFLLYALYQDARKDALQHQAALTEARYHVLENQMQPHFLFNALNSLAELIESGNPNAAETALTLSDLYRKILHNSQSRTSSLQSEIEIAQAYLEMEKLRFGDRLNFSIRIPKLSEQIFIPSLVIQTLVENAVKHGISKSIEGGMIEVNVGQRDESIYELQIRNSGIPFTPDENNKGSGLANTLERLNLLYENRHRFSIRKADDGNTIVRFYFTGEKID